MPQSASSTAYHAARLLTGPNLQPIEDGVVIVQADTIRYVGPPNNAPAADQSIDLGDATLLPGLIDAHVHLCWDASTEPHAIVSAESPLRTVLRAAAQARRQIEAGVTTVRDLGATEAISVPLARAVEDGDLPGPRIIAAGRCIAMTGGHGWFLGREADGPEAVRAAVRAEIKGGARCIKVIASGGVYGHDEDVNAPQLTPDELRAAVEEAHKAGRHVAAHAYAPGSIGPALDAGVDSIEHGSFLDRATAELMRQLGVFLVPTISVYDAMARNADRLGAPEYITRKTAQVIDQSRSAFRLAREIGVPIAAGTDCGAPGHPHGTLREELRLMVECGAAPREALAIGTMAGARLLRIGELTGSLDVGKQADLLGVGGDPTADIAALSDVRLVVRGGQRYV